VVIGIGIDVVSIGRFAAALHRHGGRLEARVFTRAELAACESRADRHAALAVRFAAKEACLKALGTGWSAGLAFGQVEVEGGGGTPPVIRLHGPAAARAGVLGVTRSHVSLSHDGPVAVAMVVLESDRP